MIEKEDEIKTPVFQKVWDFNLDLFKLLCKLDRYKDKMTKEIYGYIVSKLYLLYDEEFQHMMSGYLIERAQEKYEDEKRRERIIPREGRFFHRKNKVAKRIGDIIIEEERKYLAELKARLEAEQAERRREAVSNAGAESSPQVGENASSDQAKTSSPCGEVKSNVPGMRSPHVGEHLPITTLQAADELVKPIVLKEEGPPMPKELAEYITDYFNKICPDDLPLMTQPKALDMLVKEIAEKVLAERAGQTGETAQNAGAGALPASEPSSPQVQEALPDKTPKKPEEMPQKGEEDKAAQEPEVDAEEPEESAHELGEDYGIDTEYEIIEEEEADDVEGG